MVMRRQQRPSGGWGGAIVVKTNADTHRRHGHAPNALNEKKRRHTQGRGCGR